MFNLKCLLAALLISASLPTLASTLAGTTSGTSLSNPLYAGQSFILGSIGDSDDSKSASIASLGSASPLSLENGTFDNITFNFYSASASPAPYAVGTGYLFSQAYTGTPSQLSSSSTGLLGTASSNGSVYTFSPTLTLTTGVQYYFYEDALLQPISGNSTYTAGASHASSSFYTNFTGPLPTLNYEVNGDPAPLTVTPEPSTLVLLCTGILGMAGAIRKRFV